LRVAPGELIHHGGTETRRKAKLGKEQQQQQKQKLIHHRDAETQKKAKPKTGKVRVCRERWRPDDRVHLRIKNRTAADPPEPAAFFERVQTTSGTHCRNLVSQPNSTEPSYICRIEPNVASNNITEVTPRVRETTGSGNNGRRGFTCCTADGNAESDLAKKNPSLISRRKESGGEGGIRTPDRAFDPITV